MLIMITLNTDPLEKISVFCCLRGVQHVCSLRSCKNEAIITLSLAQGSRLTAVFIINILNQDSLTCLFHNWNC